jgi:hypothetical protein
LGIIERVLEKLIKFFLSWTEQTSRLGKIILHGPGSSPNFKPQKIIFCDPKYYFTIKLKHKPGPMAEHEPNQADMRVCVGLNA